MLSVDLLQISQSFLNFGFGLLSGCQKFLVRISYYCVVRICFVFPVGCFNYLRNSTVLYIFLQMFCHRKHQIVFGMLTVFFHRKTDTMTSGNMEFDSTAFPILNLTILFPYDNFLRFSSSLALWKVTLKNAYPSLIKYSASFSCD